MPKSPRLPRPLRLPRSADAIKKIAEKSIIGPFKKKENETMDEYFSRVKSISDDPTHPQNPICVEKVVHHWHMLMGRDKGNQLFGDEVIYKTVGGVSSKAQTITNLIVNNAKGGRICEFTQVVASDLEMERQSKIANTRAFAEWEGKKEEERGERPRFRMLERTNSHYLASREIVLDIDHAIPILGTLPVAQVSPRIANIWKAVNFTLFRFIRSVKESSPGKYHTHIPVALSSPGFTEEKLNFLTSDNVTVYQSLREINYEANVELYRLMHILWAKLIALTGADMAATSNIRLMSLPGFLHPGFTHVPNPDSPEHMGFVSRVVYENPDSPELTMSDIQMLLRMLDETPESFRSYKDAIQYADPEVYAACTPEQLVMLDDRISEEAAVAKAERDYENERRLVLLAAGAKHPRRHKISDENREKVTQQREQELQVRQEHTLVLAKEVAKGKVLPLPQLLTTKADHISRKLKKMLYFEDGTTPRDLYGQLNEYAKAVVTFIILHTSYDLESRAGVEEAFAQALLLIGGRSSEGIDKERQSGTWGTPRSKFYKRFSGLIKSNLSDGFYHRNRARVGKCPPVREVASSTPVRSQEDLCSLFSSTPIPVSSAHFAEMLVNKYTHVTGESLQTTDALDKKANAFIKNTMSAIFAISHGAQLSLTQKKGALVHEHADSQGGWGKINSCPRSQPEDQFDMSEANATTLKNGFTFDPSTLLLSISFFVASKIVRLSFGNGHGFPHINRLSSLRLFHSTGRFTKASRQGGMGTCQVRTIQLSLYELCSCPALFFALPEDTREEVRKLLMARPELMSTPDIKLAPHSGFAAERRGSLSKSQVVTAGKWLHFFERFPKAVLLMASPAHAMKHLPLQGRKAMHELSALPYAAKALALALSVQHTKKEWDEERYEALPCGRLAPISSPYERLLSAASMLSSSEDELSIKALGSANRIFSPSILAGSGGKRDNVIRMKAGGLGNRFSKWKRKEKERALFLSGGVPIPEIQEREPEQLRYIDAYHARNKQAA